ncbi:MAG: hypothetical protein B7Z81_03430, partial [Acidocella sp. 20-61-6]
MTPKLHARLDRLAARRQVEWLATLQRCDAVRAEGAAQLGVLSAYRERLASGWQSGAVLPAGQALRAAQFAAAGRLAADRLETDAAQAQAGAEAARTGFAEAQAQRDALATTRRRAAQAAADLAEK